MHFVPIVGSDKGGVGRPIRALLQSVVTAQTLSLCLTFCVFDCQAAQNLLAHVNSSNLLRTNCNVQCIGLYIRLILFEYLTEV